MNAKETTIRKQSFAKRMTKFLMCKKTNKTFLTISEGCK